jgi:hypothetical protein
MGEKLPKNRERSRSESSKPKGQVSSNPALWRIVTPEELKCEGTRIPEGRSPKSSQSSIGKGRVAEDLPLRRKVTLGGKRAGWSKNSRRPKRRSSSESSIRGTGVRGSLTSEVVHSGGKWNWVE